MKKLQKSRRVIYRDGFFYVLSRKSYIYLLPKKSFCLSAS